MKRFIAGALVVIFMLAAVLLPAPGIAGTFNPNLGASWRCGNLLMEEGIDKLQVLSNCGEPVAVEKTYIDQYGEVEKLVYGPDAGYYYVLYFYVGKLVAMEEIRQ
ncbi:MAG TPA: DUF2845 domain-containing protein [Desulfobacterales bacterium]